MGFENLKVTKEEHVARVVIDHPPANAWNLATMSEFEEVVGDLEAEGSEIVRTTKDRREGFHAFLEKRRPKFVGR